MSIVNYYQLLLLLLLIIIIINYYYYYIINNNIIIIIIFHKERVFTKTKKLSVSPTYLPARMSRFGALL
jgi:hypothetical protein